MSISTAFNIARSGLRATEGRADMVAGNIANSQTPGYARREDEHVSVGAGQDRVVQMRMVRQVDDRLADLSRNAQSAMGAANAPVEVLRGYLMTLGEIGEEVNPAARLAEFQSSLDLLTNNPSDPSVQTDVLNRAEAVARSLNTASAALADSFSQAGDSLATATTSVNAALEDIAHLNAQIRATNPGSAGAGELLDEMNRRLNALSTEIDFDTKTETDGTISVFTTGGTELVRGDDAVALTANRQTGELSIDGTDITPGAAGVRGIASGRLAGLSTLLSTTMPEMNAQLDELARGLIESFEQADASVVPGDPGLFTDEGAAYDAASFDGLAGRISVNDAVRPDAGGALWRLRDGVGAATQGEPGATDQITDFINVFTVAQPMAGDVGLGVTARLGDFAAAMVSHQQNVRVDAERTSDDANIRYAAFEDSRSRIEGVNVDTELQRLLDIERAYGANAQVLSSLNAMLDTLLNAV